MKTKIFVIVLLVSTLGLVATSSFLIYDNGRLRNSINRQDSIINRKLKDDKFDKKIENYTDSIKTVTEKISILINNKEVSGTQIVNVIDKLESQKDSLENKLWETSQLLKYAKDTYSFNIYLQKTKNGITLNRNESPADSAKMLLRYFRKRLTKDKNGAWSVDELSAESKKKLRDAVKSLDSTGVKIK